MKFLNKFIYEKNEYDFNRVELLKCIDEVQEGQSQDENFLYFRHDENIKIYDRVCDHNGGRLSIKGNAAICPLHGWRLDLSTGRYLNSGCSKIPIAEINDQDLESSFINIPIQNSRLSTQNWTSKKTTEIRFINHACLLIKIGDLTFATDPWIHGSAFSNGWWLAKPSPDDAFDMINKCNFIYISHNHPDHLHPESLMNINKDIPILTAGFESNSTINYLKLLGFSNVIAMDFVSSLVDYENEISLSVLKSGDFRDDSGLFFQHGKFKCLLNVDSNFLNFGKLPIVDLFCSSFAGGASGFPLCFENYSEEEKRIIISRNRGAIKATNLANIKNTRPKFFLPYAGFFTESSKRDAYIKENNKKNKIEDYEDICSSNGCNLLNVNQEQIFVFYGSDLVDKRKDKKLKVENPFIEKTKKSKSREIDDQIKSLIFKYFQGSNFKDDLLLDLRPTCDNFQSGHIAFKIDFSSENCSIVDFCPSAESLEGEAKGRNLRYLRIKVRREELLDVLINGKPWEDLSIGFQCRIFRSPNIYNSKFWFHFTNYYIGDKVIY